MGQGFGVEEVSSVDQDRLTSSSPTYGERESERELTQTKMEATRTQSEARRTPADGNEGDWNRGIRGD